MYEFDDTAYDEWILAERANRPTTADMLQVARSDGRGWGGRWLAHGSQECGTIGGYYYHKNHHTPYCRPCIDAFNAAPRARPQRKPRILKPCGTMAAYRRHLYNGEPVDVLCRTKARRVDQKFRDSKKMSVRTGR